MSNFFKRWSDLKQSQTKPSPAEISTQVQPEAQEASSPVAEINKDLNNAEKESPVQTVGPTLDDVAKLQRDSDFSAFVRTDVGDDVHHAAMKKLFSDPHYNIMDGLDIYIDDYSKEDPLPAGMLEKMVQSSMLGLFKKVEEKLPDIVDTETQTKLDVDEDTPKVTDAVTEDISRRSQEDQTLMTKGGTDDSDTRL
jgi:Protein of unknown function (DUF3306)